MLSIPGCYAGSARSIFVVCISPFSGTSLVMAFLVLQALIGTHSPVERANYVASAFSFAKWPLPRIILTLLRCLVAFFFYVNLNWCHAGRMAPINVGAWHRYKLNRVRPLALIRRTYTRSDAITSTSCRSSVRSSIYTHPTFGRAPLACVRNKVLSIAAEVFPLL